MVKVTRIREQMPSPKQHISISPPLANIQGHYGSAEQKHASIEGVCVGGVCPGMLSSGHDMAMVILNSQELVVSHTRPAHGQASQNYRINPSLESYWLLEERESWFVFCLFGCGH